MILKDMDEWGEWGLLLLFDNVMFGGRTTEIRGILESMWALFMKEDLTTVMFGGRTIEIGGTLESIWELFMKEDSTLNLESLDHFSNPRKIADHGDCLLTEHAQLHLNYLENNIEII